MKTTRLIIGLLQLANIAISSEATQSSLTVALQHLYKDSILGKRQQIDLYYITLCENANYGGRCAKVQAAWGICHTIIQENENWASSAKADAGGNCVLYAEYKCAGTSAAVSSTGISNLAASGLDNQVSSFRCGS